MAGQSRGQVMDKIRNHKHIMIEEKELENIFFPKKIRYMELFEEKKYDEA